MATPNAGNVPIDSYYVDDHELHESSDGEEGDLQEQVSELQENLKAVREEVNAMKIGTTSKSVRTSNPIYHTLDEDGKVIEEKASDQEQEQEKITYNRFSIPGGGVNLNLRNRRDVAPSRKMGKRYVLLLFALFITSIVIAVVIAFVISKIQYTMIREEETRENDKLMQEMTREYGKLMQEMKKPQSMFNCYQANDVKGQGIVTYSNCTVDTTDGAINVVTGIFTVTDPGIYHLHFQAVGRTEEGAKYFYCTMYVDDEVSEKE